MTDPRLQLEGITRRYGPVLANDRVSLTVMPGEIHAVAGENGAGKSTLMKVIYGALRPDAGEIRWNGAPVQVRSPAQARALGIAMVFQHFALFDTLTVAQNVLLGLGRRASLRAVAQGIREKADQYGLALDPMRPVHTLSVGERQRVELLRALLCDPRLLILDEPTSVLTPQAIEPLFGTLRRLAADGCSILYVSHRLDELRALCDRCTVLRAGRVAGVVQPAQHSAESLARLMIGAEPRPPVRRASLAGDVALRVTRLTLAPSGRFGVPLREVTLQVRAGQIMGLAGVSGNGQRELFAALSGEDTRADRGAVELCGRPIGDATPRARRALGLHCVPEERLGRGVVPSMSLAENLLLTRAGRPLLRAGGWIDRRRLAAAAASVIGRFGVQAPGPWARACSLSGGNLQKYLVGREIDARPRVLLLAQPTWGVDVGAAARIRSELFTLRDAGCAVLVLSEDLDELLGIADVLRVIARGRVSPPLAAAEATRQQIGQWMSGLWPDSARQAPDA